MKRTKRTANKERRRVGNVVLFGAILTSAATFGAFSTRVAAADGDCLWGANSEKTTYLPAYNPLFPPNIPVLTRPETTATSANGAGAATISTTNGVSGVASGSVSSVPGGGGSTSVALSEIDAKLAESGTLIGSDGKTYFYRYVKGVQQFRVVETRRVYETPPGGLFPIWSDVQTEKIVWKPVLIKVLTPRNADPSAAANSGSTPAPCRPVENGARL